jgi:hypothetical protein
MKDVIIFGLLWISLAIAVAAVWHIILNNNNYPKP